MIFGPEKKRCIGGPRIYRTFLFEEISSFFNIHHQGAAVFSSFLSLRTQYPLDRVIQSRDC